MQGKPEESTTTESAAAESLTPSDPVAKEKKSPPPCDAHDTPQGDCSECYEIWFAALDGMSRWKRKS